MKKLIVYCHGYASSPNTDKVERLCAVKNSEVHAFPIDVDPDVSLPKLCEEIDNLLLEDMHQDAELMFVGTSLGAWYAAYLGLLYSAHSVLINPCYNPSVSLKKYDVATEVLDSYPDMVVPGNSFVVIAKDDDVIDYSDFSLAKDRIVFTPTGGHRFNGDEFEDVIVAHLNRI